MIKWEVRGEWGWVDVKKKKIEKEVYNEKMNEGE